MTFGTFGQRNGFCTGWTSEPCRGFWVTTILRRLCVTRIFRQIMRRRKFCRFRRRKQQNFWQTGNKLATARIPRPHQFPSLRQVLCFLGLGRRDSNPDKQIQSPENTRQEVYRRILKHILKPAAGAGLSLVGTTELIRRVPK